MSSKKLPIQFYADECFPLTSVTYLRSLGYSVIHAFDVKLTGKSDGIHLKKGKNLKRTLITLDRDFLYYIQTAIEHQQGITVLSLSEMTPENVSNVCKKLFKRLSPDIVHDAVIRASNTKYSREKQGKLVFEKTF